MNATLDSVVSNSSESYFSGVGRDQSLKLLRHWPLENSGLQKFDLGLYPISLDLLENLNVQYVK